MIPVPSHFAEDIQGGEVRTDLKYNRHTKNKGEESFSLSEESKHHSCIAPTELYHYIGSLFLYSSQHLKVMTISVKFSTMEIKPMFVSSESSTDSGSETCDSFAIQPVVTVRKSKDAKRPQMKYDPAIPMTKEQTSAWRREQRRKRNRESAAACRKRQRDLISELEVEVDGWKAKFDDALAKLRQLEGDESAQMNAQDIEKMFPIRCSSPSCEGMASSSSSQDDMTLSPCMSFNLMQAQPNHVVSPYDNRSGCVVPPVTYSAETLDLPVLEETLIKTNKQANLNAQQHSFSRVEKRQHLTEIITRPAKSRLLPSSRRRRSNPCFGYIPTQ
jgi:hypothetical protein